VKSVIPDMTEREQLALLLNLVKLYFDMKTTASGTQLVFHYQEMIRRGEMLVECSEVIRKQLESRPAGDVLQPSSKVSPHLSDERLLLDELVSSWDAMGVVGLAQRRPEAHVAFLSTIQRVRKLQLDYPNTGTLVEVPFSPASSSPPTSPASSSTTPEPKG